jgi:hypothetical protein
MHLSTSEDELYRLVHLALNTFGDEISLGFSALPGQRFVDVFEQWIDGESLDNWETLRNSAVSEFETTLTKDGFDYSSSNYFVERILGYGLRCLIQSAEIYTDPKVNSIFSPDSLQWYIGGGAAKLPQPPLSIHEKHGVGFNLLDIEYTKERLIPVLMPWIFLISALESMWTGEAVRCPVIYSEEKVLFKDPWFRPDSNCEKATIGGPCGSVALGGSLAGHCNCPWKECMINWALASA